MSSHLRRGDSLTADDYAFMAECLRALAANLRETVKPDWVAGPMRTRLTTYATRADSLAQKIGG